MEKASCQKDNPLVSIIMGAYNCDKFVGRSIDSVLNQTYTNWELIICDDASIDNTYSILKEYAEKDKRILILKNESNLKLAASLNRCLSVAKGKYVARLDADDECLKNRLKLQVEYLEKHKNIDVVGSSRILFNELGDYGIAHSNENPTKDTLLFDTPFAHPTIMMKKTTYDYLGGYNTEKDTMRCEDLDLWFRFYENGFVGKNLDIPLYRYHLSEDDYKKRSIKAAIGTTKVFVKGYKKIRIPFYKYVFALKPVIVAMIPNRIMYIIQKKRFETKE